MSSSSKREMEIFAEALELPANERTAFLAKVCGDDETLRQGVEALLQADEDAGKFMDRGPIPPVASPTPEATVEEQPGSRIGRYKLLQKIGEGGCGVVYMAEQEEPVRRRVALKIIKAGMDTKSVIARFEAERQALALMDHPNIAKVLDAGATESGRPYFVMELVRGVKITQYCDEHSLSTAERLQLFIQVCQAVQHAHQKGIIHRDLKPSNILVTTSLDGTALPVVIDFGIAKATTNQRLTDKTLFTAFEMLIGTPAYMSPEQAVLTSIDVDTRTDIYSLGVLLYELLTSMTVFDAGELMKAGLDEVRRVIREQEALRPSSRLSRMTKSDLTTVAQHHRAEPPKLIREVHGDLDWIVMKALEKDRTRRYETANGLALDIKRYLANETISARPPSALYRLQKAIQRHKVLFGAIALITVLLIASLIVISASLAEERRSRREADAALAKSQQVTRFLEDMLQGVGPSVARGRDTTMLREILDKAADRVGTELATQPLTQAELQNRIGAIYVDLDSFDKAEALQQRALATQRKYLGEASREAATTLSTLGYVLNKQGKYAEAEARYREAIAMQKKVLGHEDPEVAGTLKALGGVFYAQRRISEAREVNNEALRIRRKRFGNESLEVADSLNALAIVLNEEGNYAEAAATDREVLKLRRKLLGPDHPLTVASLTNLGMDLSDEYKLAESEACLREAVALRRKLYGESHSQYAYGLSCLGNTLWRLDRWIESEQVRRQAFEIQSKLFGREMNWKNADSAYGLAADLRAQKKFAEAEVINRQVYELARKTSSAERSGRHLSNLLGVLCSQKKFADAEQFLTDYADRDFPARPLCTDFLWSRAYYLARRSRWAAAAADMSLVMQSGAAAPVDYSVLAPLLVETNDTGRYRQLCRDILKKFGNSTTAVVVDRMALCCLLLPLSGVDLPAIGRMTANADHAGLDEKSTHYYQFCQALLEYRQGHFSRAVEWARDAANDPRPEVQCMSQAVLSMSHHQLGKTRETQAAWAQAKDLSQRYLLPRGSEDLGEYWNYWVYAQTLLNEAAGVLDAAPDSTRRI